MSDPTPAILDRIDADQSRALDRLMELLRIPSISTDPAHADDCDTAADWLVAELSHVGFDASKRATSGHPMVVAHGGKGDRHVLFYGHYDVQPVDPLSQWDHNPFDPRIDQTPRGPVIRARGASDDKGQLMTFVEACRHWKAETGDLPCRVTILFEGEEECGSPSLVPFLETNKEELTAEIALICDSGLYDDRVPAIITTLRGLLGEELTIKGPDRDLHSGIYGGPAINPARVLTRILGRLHDEQGRVTVPGFYDGVGEPPSQVKEGWKQLNFSTEAFLGEVGLSHPAGEVGRSGLEMLWSRPTAEINGLSSGYTGDGFKTVLPSKATAKVSFRLVGGQDPQRLRTAFRDWVIGQLPPDCHVSFQDHGAAPASAMQISNPIFSATQLALTEEWGTEAAYVGGGGSIPIAGYFQSILGMECVLTGFAKDDDAIHSPNEKYDVENFHKGVRSWARILGRIAA
ncbi:Acetylornithine deacetylase/Succinyl-diaminopimelate desuccinylase [Jannaschia faecimaris]|uniref:Acetylornithine deacetylase/Succinyl-diaminopimelate desuccinylase n=1 Tax=Jannaschia faecimaris TaxID=1244108 RepID=A0A1H3SLD1_9RHOB|nr:M20/M25/M40 family metallo-hydrolase [Jannaschia faecimaris]SDZ38883.1 Acetylornithine deacetylase/Succinyl-diaminopimelate desuccinylase [Jannaschia faecimaris]